MRSASTTIYAIITFSRSVDSVDMQWCECQSGGEGTQPMVEKGKEWDVYDRVKGGSQLQLVVCVLETSF